MRFNDHRASLPQEPSSGERTTHPRNWVFSAVSTALYWLCDVWVSFWACKYLEKISAGCAPAGDPCYGEYYHVAQFHELRGRYRQCKGQCGGRRALSPAEVRGSRQEALWCWVRDVHDAADSICALGGQDGTRCLHMPLTARPANFMGVGGLGALRRCTALGAVIDPLLALSLLAAATGSATAGTWRYGSARATR